jgi:hypothetical protein
MLLMKPSNYLQLVLAVVFFVFALTLPVSAPTWLFAITLGVAGIAGFFGACSLCNIFDEDKLFRLPPAKIEHFRAMHRRGDG